VALNIAFLIIGQSGAVIPEGFTMIRVKIANIWLP